MIKKNGILLILVSFFYMVNISQIRAEVKPGAWTWKLSSSDFMESNIAIFNGKKALANYVVGCDLSDAVSKNIPEEEESARIEKYISTDIPNGVLLVTCIVGAHSKEVSIFDPRVNSREAVFSKTGSYYAGWEVSNNQLMIFYDRPCEVAQKDCENYQRVSVKWPMNENLNK